MKNIVKFKLLLFFVFLFSVTFYSHKVFGKEIKYEMRGTYLNLNSFNISEVKFEEIKNYITKSYDDIKNRGFNTVLVDISEFVDLYITENFNKKHEDILNMIVKEGFKRSLDIHASFSEFTLKNVIDGNLEVYLTNLSNNSFMKNNIEWIIKFNDKYYLDLGVDEVRENLVNAIVNLSSKFKFDGVYLNNVGYPENINKYIFNDSYSYMNYNEDKLVKDSWRRQNVNDFIKILGEKFKSYRNQLKFGIGVNYIWRTIEEDENGIDFEGVSDYDKGSFDSLNIAKNSYVDYIIVKIDDSISEKNDIDKVINWWEKKLRTYLIDVFIQGNDNILNIVESIREDFFVNGFILKEFEKSNVIDHLVSEKSLSPRFKSYDSYYTASNINVTYRVVGENIEFNILDDGFENTKKFVIYKFLYDDLNFESAKYIKDVYPSNGKNTKITLKKENGVYAITKLNYNSIENKIDDLFIVNDEFGIIESKFNMDKPKISNEKIDFLLNSNNPNNEYKIEVERNGQLVYEKDFTNEKNHSFIPDTEGIYKVNILVSKNKDRDNLLRSHFKMEIKDKYVVVLDAGHGGSELGAKGFNQILEKDINLAICKYITEILSGFKKVDVKNTRINDIKMDLSDRVKMSSFLGGDIFLSVHQNAFDNERVNGIESYYYLKEVLSKELCSFIQKDLVNKTVAYDRGIKNSNFVVLRENIIPSVLIECGFITNPDECEKLVKEDYQKGIAEAIVNSIKKFLCVEEI